MRRDYLGDVQAAFERLDAVSPRMAQADIDNSDLHPHRYGVTLWNLFGKWHGSQPTLAASIHEALDRAEAARFGFPEAPSNG